MSKFGDAAGSEEERESFRTEFEKAQKEFMKKAPTPEDFMKIIDQLKTLSEEEREKLKKKFAEKTFNPENMKNLFGKRQSMEISSLDYFVFIGMIALIVFVIGESSQSLSGRLQVKAFEWLNNQFGGKIYCGKQSREILISFPRHNCTRSWNYQSN